ncbi:MAG: T9SS type A sorting domain-containing protein [bacterium]
MKVVSLIIIMSAACGSLLLAQNNEFLFDTNLIYMPVYSGQSYPAVAFDGTNYFVVWFDRRNTIPYHYEDSGYLNVYGCRVTPEGILLDSAGIFISYCIRIAGYVPEKPAIAYGCGNFLVTWIDYLRNGSLYGARIDTGGIVLDPDGFIVCTYSSAKASPDIAFDGNNYFAVWSDMRDPAGVYACRIHPDGAILDPEGVFISNAGGDPAVAFDGTNYLVVFTNGDIYGVRVDTAGIVLDTNAFAICTATNDQWCPSVAFGNLYNLVTWQDFRSGSDDDIYGARVDTAGVLLDTNSIALSTYSTGEFSPDVDFDSINYLVSWSDYTNIYCTRVDTAGVVLDPGGIIVSQDTIYEDHSVSIAFDGINYFITWQGNFGDNDIYGARIETSGAVIDTSTLLLSMSAYSGRASFASFDGTNYFAVWEDYRNSLSSCIYGARIDTFGTVLDSDGIPIINGINPTIAFDGSKYLAVCSGINGVRIDTNGSVLDTMVIFSNGGKQPAIIFDGINYFVVWNYAWDIYGARIDTAGAVLDTNAILISNGEYYEGYPSVAFDGTNYFVVWQYGNPITPYKIYGARVDTAGTLLDTIPIQLTAGQYPQCPPDVGFDGTNFFMVWQDARHGWDNVDIYGARVRPDGVLLDTNGIPLCTMSSCQYAPQIKFDGQNYCVIWEDWRNGDYTDIYGCYINPSGTVIEESLVSDQPNLQLEPALAKGSDKFLITYTGFTDSLGTRPANTMRIWGKFQNFTCIEENDPQIPGVGCMLFQNSPNPFTQTTKIRYYLTNNSKANLKIYDVCGKLVRQFVYPYIRQSNQIIWDGKDDFGNHVGTGVYFYRLNTDDLGEVKKMIFLR